MARMARSNASSTGVVVESGAWASESCVVWRQWSLNIPGCVNKSAHVAHTLFLVTPVLAILARSPSRPGQPPGPSTVCSPGRRQGTTAVRGASQRCCWWCCGALALAPAGQRCAPGRLLRRGAGADEPGFCMALRTIPFGGRGHRVRRAAGRGAVGFAPCARLRLGGAGRGRAMAAAAPGAQRENGSTRQGVLWALAAAVCWAVYILFGKRVGHLHTGTRSRSGWPWRRWWSCRWVLRTRADACSPAVLLTGLGIGCACRARYRSCWRWWRSSACRRRYPAS